MKVICPIVDRYKVNRLNYALLFWSGLIKCLATFSNASTFNFENCIVTPQYAAYLKLSLFFCEVTKKLVLACTW